MRNLFIFSLILLIVNGCSSPQISKQNKSVQPEPEKSVLSEEYLREGFITENIFRVVIVSPEKSDGLQDCYIRRMAEQRAYHSFQKILREHSIEITSRNRKAIMQIIQSHGSLMPVCGTGCKEFVYHLNIKKENLKRYLIELGRNNLQ